MRILKAQFEITTPMFLGGSQQECATLMRGASIKGALRAYFRALNWSRIRKALPDNHSALKQLHKEEAAIFGSAVKDNQGGQASFLLRVASKPFVLKRELTGSSAETQYLLGMGLYDYKIGMKREHIPEGNTFELELAIKPSLSANQVQQLKDTLLAFGLLGGLGSRARKGFGSVSIIKLQDNDDAVKLPTTPAEYIQAIKALLGELDANEPPLTAFSQHTKLQISGIGKEAMLLLKKHGYEMGMYRSYGRKTGDKRIAFKNLAEQNFKFDHDWMVGMIDKKPLNGIPKRTVFGLPHPYRSSSGANVSFEPKGGRRASPLFAHVHKLADNQYVLVHSIMRSQFLPDAMPIVAGANRFNKEYKNSHEKIDWTVLDTFLQRFKPKAEDVIYG